MGGVGGGESPLSYLSFSAKTRKVVRLPESTATPGSSWQMGNSSPQWPGSWRGKDPDSPPLKLLGDW